MMKPNLIKYFIAALVVILIGSHYAVGKWFEADAISKLGKKQVKALLIEQGKNNELNKALSDMALVLHKQTGKAYSNNANDQRIIRQLGEQLDKAVISLADRSNIILQLTDLFRLLDRSAMHNDLPEDDHPEGRLRSYETITYAELVGYAREIIARYEIEGLRCNSFRKKVKKLSCVN